MFGDLFEEEESTYTSIPQSKGKVCEPPPPRGKLKLSGIRNQGSTCYLNSLLQTLLHTPEFREELFSLGPEEIGRLEDKDKPDSKVRVIPLELQNLFVRLLLLDEQTTTTAALTESFGWTNSEEMAQQDVQELNRILFSALESSLVETAGSSLIQRLYHGNLINSITCSECHNVSERQEDFLDLTVCVRGVSNLEEALWSMFVEEELFEGNNLYRCSHCDRLVRATKCARLRTLPPFLSVSLLRFSFDLEKCERFKETRRYSFPLSINLRPFCEQSDQPDSELSYELYSIIIHKGGCYGGHYHAYIKDIDQLGHWELPGSQENDVKQKKQKVQVKPVSMSVCDSAVEKEDPLSLLTAVLAQESGCVLVDQLGQKLMEKIGCSWNKKFRKLYGPIRKFLQSNSDVFVLMCNGSRVALRNLAETPEQGVEPKSGAGSVQDEFEAGSDPGLEAEPVSGHWFDLNDSTVTAIKESDIIKQYEGKESAYMLFYRKCTLQRPRHAVGNPAFGVPAHLLHMVQEENAKLHQRRSEFEVSSNSIDVRLHFVSHYCIENGALKLQDMDTHTETHMLTLSIDRRRTVGDLRLAVYQLQDAWEGDMALTIAKNLPAGLHLYDTLTDDQQSLSSAGVYNGSDLFVWNGTEVNGVCVQTGAEYEPLLLNILRPAGAEADSLGVAGEESMGDSGLVHVKQGFSGGVTLGGVREALSLQEALVCHQAKGVWPGGEGGGASRWKVCSAEAMRRTLRELTLRDGDTLLLLPHTHLNNSVFSVNEDVLTVMTPSDCRWLQVEFHTHTTQEEEEKNLMKIPAAGSTLLSEVKQRVLEEMQRQEHFTGGVCCLRERDRTGKLLPPVCEDLTVRDAGIKLMTSLCLCPGRSPTPSQLFLYVSVAPPTGPELEIIVEKTLTVKECLMAMLQEAGLHGTCWHLRRMDWCEEVGDPLMDENASLLDIGVVNGDTLVITEGQLPPKGFLRLPVSWFIETSDECERNHTTESHSTGLQSVGCVEISEETSLHKLRCQMLTLPALVQLCVPTPEFLRVWLIEGKKLIRILRGNQLTLRKLKLSVGSEVCVQKLPYEENLGLKDILLRLQVGVAKEEMGVPENSAYFPTHEFVWEAGLDSSPRGLYHAVSTHCGISPENLLLAKHLPEQHTWIAINYRIHIHSVSNKKKKKQKQSNSKGVNLQGAPYYLRDGDTIAVKNLLIDSNRESHTVKNEHTLGEQSWSSEKKKNRKAEVALSIKVGVFR